MMRDMFDNELNPGDVISYVTRHSSSMTPHIAKVTWVGERAVKVLTYQPGYWARTYNTTLTSNKTIVVIDQSRLPQHIKFFLGLLDLSGLNKYLLGQETNDE